MKPGKPIVNIEDLAKACNVSIATVSRSLTGKNYVKKETKEKVLRQAKDMGYIYDSNAQILQRGKSYRIGIIISDIENYFYNLVLKNIIFELENRGYRVLISYSFENTQIEKENIVSLLSSKVDGIIFTPISNKNRPLIDLIKKRNIPVVQLFRQAYDDVDAICVDDEFGAYLATKHFLGQNLHNILLASVKLDFTPNRSKGYIRAYEEENLRIDNDLLIHLPLGVSVKKDCENILSNHKVDAIIAGTNTFGSEIIQILNEQNTHIPLIVFDELPWLKMLNISTIAQPIDEIYKSVVDTIFDKLTNVNYDNGADGRNIKIKPTLLVRQSSIINL